MACFYRACFTLLRKHFVRRRDPCKVSWRYRTMKKNMFCYVLALVLIPILSGQRLFADEVAVTEKSDSVRVLFDFSDEAESGQWVAVNDNVMGGLSTGGPSLAKDSCLVFSGSTSLENNGGFSSIRTIPQDFDLDGYTGFRIRLSGDGRTYQFRLRGDANFDGIAFKYEFTTEADTWIEIDIPIASCIPSFRGRILGDVAPIEPSQIKQMGFLIGDKKAGPFRLRIESIKAY